LSCNAVISLNGPFWAQNGCFKTSFQPFLRNKFFEISVFGYLHGYWLYQAKKRYSGLRVLNYAHDKWVNRAMQTDNRGEENKWTQSIAVGSKTLVEKMKEALGFRAKVRKIICADDTFELREMLTPYGKANNQDSGNTFLWDQPPPSLISQFLHENRSIKTEMLVFFGIFSRFFNMLLWPDPRPGICYCGPTPAPAP